MNYLQCPDLSENKIVSFYANINNKNFKFLFKWSDYCKCCFLSIFDNNGEPVNTGNALCNKTIIKNDNRVLPNFIFIHQDELGLEPTAETIKDYIIAYTAE